MLAECRTVDEVKDVRDKAEAVRLYCKNAKLGLAAQNEAALLKIEAERRAGEMLAGMDLRTGPNWSHAATNLKDIGITKSDSSRWQSMATLPDDDFESYVETCQQMERELTSSALLKMAKKRSVVESVANRVDDEPIADGVTDSLESLIADGHKYRTIYADPPWQYDNQATRASTDNHYTTMPVSDIAALPVNQLVEDEALLFLWTTNGFLFECKEVIDAWGFEFKSSMVWVKTQMGIGNYVRNAHELLLICNRGGCQTEKAGRSQMSWVECERGQHSAKPIRFRKIVESLSRSNRLELFGRQAADGWTVFGNQIQSGGLC